MPGWANIKFLEGCVQDRTATLYNSSLYVQMATWKKEMRETKYLEIQIKTEDNWTSSTNYSRYNRLIIQMLLLLILKRLKRADRVSSLICRCHGTLHVATNSKQSLLFEFKRIHTGWSCTVCICVPRVLQRRGYAMADPAIWPSQGICRGIRPSPMQWDPGQSPASIRCQKEAEGKCKRNDQILTFTNPSII